MCRINFFHTRSEFSNDDGLHDKCSNSMGKGLTIGGNFYPIQATDVNIGILYIFGVVSIGVYGIMIGGWASNNKYSLLGALRASSQMISYEIAMGLSIIALVMMTGTLSVREIAEQQAGGHWNVFYQPFGF